MIFSNYKYSIYYVNTRGEEQPGNRPAPRITQGKKRCWIGSGSFSNSIGVETRLLTCESQIGFAWYIRSDAFKINSLYFFFFSFFFPFFDTSSPPPSFLQLGDLEGVPHDVVLRRGRWPRHELAALRGLIAMKHGDSSPLSCSVSDTRPCSVRHQHDTHIMFYSLDL